LYGATLEVVKEKLIQLPNNCSFLFYTLEYVDEFFINEVLSLTKDLGVDTRVYWWLQPSHGQSDELKFKLGKHLFLIDHDLLLLALHTQVQTTSKPNTKWNFNTGRFIFPTGKPSRVNRVRLLYKLYENNLLDKCNWSFFVNQYTYSLSKELLPEITDQEFFDFVKQHTRTIDNCTVVNAGAGEDHSNGFPFDGATYSNVSFRLISETMMSDAPIISEKTWIAMINRVPFIISGYAKNLKYLKENGYRTFENYLPIPEYDDIGNQESRLNAVVHNTKFWLDNIHLQSHNIDQDVEHNYHHLMNNINQCINLAKNLSTKLNWNHKSIYHIAPFDIDQTQWMLFYYGIKDPSWPDCLTSEGFEKLPKHIQQECIEVFGYQPPKKS
jgi:hypothetical protein